MTTRLPKNGANFFQYPFFPIPFATRNLSSEHRSAKREEGFAKEASMIWVLQVGQGVRGEPPTRFGYFSARESNARPGEGQTEHYTKASV
jgi:hypothetical protein